MLGLVKSWWGQVFLLLALIAILDRSTSFKADVGAVTGGAGSIIKDLKV